MAKPDPKIGNAILVPLWRAILREPASRPAWPLGREATTRFDAALRMAEVAEGNRKAL